MPNEYCLSIRKWILGTYISKLIQAHTFGIHIYMCRCFLAHAATKSAYSQYTAFQTGWDRKEPTVSSSGPETRPRLTQTFIQCGGSITQCVCTCTHTCIPVSIIHLWYRVETMHCFVKRHFYLLDLLLILLSSKLCKTEQRVCATCSSWLTLPC